MDLSGEGGGLERYWGTVNLNQENSLPPPTCRNTNIKSTLVTFQLVNVGILNNLDRLDGRSRYIISFF